MKLIELLVRELEEWPEGVKCLTQSAVDKEIYDALNGDSEYSVVSLSPSFYADSHHDEDMEYPIVTRAEWEAARQPVGERLTQPVPAPTLETMLAEWRTLEARAHAAQAEADALFEHAGQCHGEIVVRLAELGWGAPRGPMVPGEPVVTLDEPGAWVIDGHTAPTDATHFAVESDAYHAAWMKEHNGEWYCMLLDSDKWQLSGEDDAATEWISRQSTQP